MIVIVDYLKSAFDQEDLDQKDLFVFLYFQKHISWKKGVI